MACAAPPNAAIDFVPEAYSFEPKRILGRMAAGKGFLAGYLRHGGAEKFYCLSGNLEHFYSFTATAAELGRAATPVRWIRPHDLKTICEPGCLYHPDPRLGDLAWQRRQVGQRAYSLCGVNHTICSAGAMDGVGMLLVAPVQPWDAVICTSRAAKTAIQHMLDQWGQYLAARLQGTPRCPVQLPVIPLGVDCDAYSDNASAAQSRNTIRTRLGIGDGEIAVLYAGRLTYHAKAHPLPLYLALEAAAQRTGKQIHLIEAGWFAGASFDAEFRAAAQQTCPSVRVHFVEGRGPDYRHVWHAADVFTSLSDNIQESFGLTPIEAMAAGLPQVITDWDGYRDTVRHGIDGFRVATVTPPPGTGRELARRYFFNQLPYHLYAGHASQATAVDVGQCIEAFTRLVDSADLRSRFGAAGRQRARECFDWAVVVRRYLDVWQELAELRARAEECAPPAPDGPPHPLREDPFATFACFPTAILGPDTTVRLSPRHHPRRLQDVLKMPMMRFASSMLLPKAECTALLARLGKGACRVSDLLEGSTSEAHDHTLLRTLAWLAKADLIRVDGLTVPED